MTGERNSSRWIHQRGSGSDTTGTQRGTGCPRFGQFGAGTLLLPCQGRNRPVGQTCGSGSQVGLVPVGRVPQSTSCNVRGTECRSESRVQGKAETSGGVRRGPAQVAERSLFPSTLSLLHLLSSCPGIWPLKERAKLRFICSADSEERGELFPSHSE